MHGVSALGVRIKKISRASTGHRAATRDTGSVPFKHTMRSIGNRVLSRSCAETIEQICRCDDLGVVSRIFGKPMLLINCEQIVSLSSITEGQICEVLILTHTYL